MSVEHILSQCELGTGASAGELADLESAVGCPLPADYKRFLASCGRAEGPIGNRGYVMLWSAKEVLDENTSFDTSEFMPGLVVIGSDGGGDAYGFRWAGTAVEYIRVPFIVMCEADAGRMGSTFEEMLRFLEIDE